MILQIALGVALGLVLLEVLKWVLVRFLDWGSRANLRGIMNRVVGYAAVAAIVAIVILALSHN